MKTIQLFTIPLHKKAVLQKYNKIIATFLPEFRMWVTKRQLGFWGFYLGKKKIWNDLTPFLLTVQDQTPIAAKIESISMFSVSSFPTEPWFPSSNSHLGVPTVLSLAVAVSALERPSRLRGPSWQAGRISEELFSQTPESSEGFCRTVFRVLFKRVHDFILLWQNRAPRYHLGQRAFCDPYRRYLQTDVLTQHSFFFKLKGRKLHKT